MKYAEVTEYYVERGITCMYTFYFFILILESKSECNHVSSLICLLKVKFCLAHKINAILISLKTILQMLFHVFLFMNWKKNYTSRNGMDPK